MRWFLKRDVFETNSSSTFVLNIGRFDPQFPPRIIEYSAKNPFVFDFIVSNLRLNGYSEIANHIEKVFGEERFKKIQKIDCSDTDYVNLEVHGKTEWLKEFFEKLIDAIIFGRAAIVEKPDYKVEDDDIELDGTSFTIFKNGNSFVLIEFYRRPSGGYLRPKNYILTFDSDYVFEYPNQIDLKITNKCNANCKFCYENSVRDGGEADPDDVIRLLKVGPDFMIPEVVLGGGDVMTYPHLIDICKIIHKYGSFVGTTVDGRYFIQNKRFKELKKFIRECPFVNLGITLPFSFNEKFVENMKEFLSEFDETNVVFHVIVGVHDPELVEKYSTEMMKFEQYIPILLLGYKNVGRGKSFKPKYAYKDYELIIDLLEKKYIEFFCDELLEEEVNKMTVYFEQYPFDYMFVDLVDFKFGRNSYGEKKLFSRGDSLRYLFKKLSE